MSRERDKLAKIIKDIGAWKIDDRELEIPPKIKRLSTEERKAIFDEKLAKIEKDTKTLAKKEAKWIFTIAGEGTPDKEFLKHVKTRMEKRRIKPSPHARSFNRYITHFVEHSVATEPDEEPGVSNTTLKDKINERTIIPEGEVPDYLTINCPKQPLDDLIKTAKEKLLLDRKAFPPVAIGEWTSKAIPLNKVTNRLNKAGLPYIDRYLLSEPQIYISLLMEHGSSLDEVLEDDLGCYEDILRKLKGPRSKFLEIVVDGALKANKVELNAYERQNLLNDPKLINLPVAPDKTVPFVMKLKTTQVERGYMAGLVELYVARNEIKIDRFNESIKQRMVSYLLQSGVSIPGDDPAIAIKFDDGGFDEFFALAYHNAVNAADDYFSDSAPVGGWDFSVDIFNNFVAQAIDRDAIWAAGFLDYVYEMGERLHIFDMMDVLYLNMNRGLLELPQCEAADLLERLWRDRDRRETKEERAMAYRKVLGKGDVEVLDRMIVNDRFEYLWDNLMTEVAQYIHKSEKVSVVDSATTVVSRVPIYQAARELQYNLTDYAKGRTKQQANQLRSLYNTCFNKVLSAPEIISYYGYGDNPTCWDVIKRLIRDEPQFKSTPSLTSTQTRAEKGNIVFGFLKEFDEGTVTDAQFEKFIRAARELILLRGDEEATDEDDWNEEEGDEEFDEDEFDEFGEFGDEEFEGFED